MMLDLNQEEFTWFTLLCSAILFQILHSLFKKDKYYFWSPITVISLTYIYYAVIGPLIALANNNTIIKTIEHRHYLLTAWQGAFTSYTCILIGFYFFNFKNFKVRIINLSDKILLKKAKVIFFLSISLLFLFGGKNFITKINFLDAGTDASSESLSSSFSSYLMQSIIFFITPVLLSLRPFLNDKTKFIFWLYLLIACSIFINEAFRYRLVVLMLSVIYSYHLINKIKINIKLVLIIIIPFFLLMGIIEVARTYGRGINVEKASNYQTEELIENSFNETEVFFATGLIMDEYDNNFDKTYFDFLINAIAMPLPRAFWPSKPAGEYLRDRINFYYGKYGTGQAILNFGEYYMAFGWWGIIIFSLLIGVLSKYVFCWFKFNHNNIKFILGYSMFSSMMYLLISRGYFAQYLTLVLFILIPILIIKPKNKYLKIE